MRPAVRLASALTLTLALLACAPPAPENRASIERGRYLVTISGCNDCHTEGYMDQAGQVPERDWLTGSRRGWHNERGTTYATNLRLLISRIDEDQWVNLTRTMKTSAPMAWYRLRGIDDTDLRSIYRYVRWLGPAGEPAPPALPPGVTPPDPHIYFPAIH